MLLSEKTPVADNCSVAPDASEGEGTPTVIVVSVVDVTVALAVPETPFSEAVIVTVPAFNEFSKPDAPTVAMVGSELCHVTWLVMSWMLVSV